MQQTAIEQPLDLQEEWRKFREWAAESRSLNPFVFLAMHWYTGRITVAEGRRIEREQQRPRLLQHVCFVLEKE